MFIQEKNLVKRLSMIRRIFPISKRKGFAGVQKIFGNKGEAACHCRVLIVQPGTFGNRLDNWLVNGTVLTVPVCDGRLDGRRDRIDRDRETRTRHRDRENIEAGEGGDVSRRIAPCSPGRWAGAIVFDSGPARSRRGIAGRQVPHGEDGRAQAFAGWIRSWQVDVCGSPAGSFPHTPSNCFTTDFTAPSWRPSLFHCTSCVTTLLRARRFAP